MKRLVFVAAFVLVTALVGAGIWAWFSQEQSRPSSLDTVPSALEQAPSGIVEGTPTPAATVEEELDLDIPVEDFSDLETL